MSGMEHISRSQAGDAVRYTRRVSERPEHHQDSESGNGRKRGESPEEQAGRDLLHEEEVEPGTYDVTGRVHSAEARNDTKPHPHINYRV